MGKKKKNCEKNEIEIEKNKIHKNGMKQLSELAQRK